jgi:hypothetical protein
VPAHPGPIRIRLALGLSCGLDNERVGAATAWVSHSRSRGSVARPLSYTLPVLEPLTEYERSDGASAIVFPTAADLRAEGELDVYYGAADRVIAVARIALPAGPSSITKDS